MEKLWKNKMKKYFKGIILTAIATLFLGCGHMAYLGMHGKSVKLFPEIHDDVMQDAQCLECHHPDNPKGPVSPHPNFKGCINCHND